MDVRQLELFVAVAEELNFTRAARRVTAVQSTVSAGVKALEAELGTPLFDRSTRHVRLTAAGSELLPEAYAVLEAVGRMHDLAAGSRLGLRGRVRVGLLTNLAALDLPDVFGEFHRSHPLVDLSLVVSGTGSSGLVDDVRRGRLDVALTGLPPTDLAGLDSIRLARFPYVAVLPEDHRLADAIAVTLSDLVDEPFVDGPVGFGNRIILDRALASAGLSRVVSTEVFDLAVVPAYVRAGLGIAVIPEMTPITLAGVSTVSLRPTLIWQLRAIAATPQVRRSRAVTALLDLLEGRYG